MSKVIKDTIVDDVDSESASEALNYRYEITSYGADYPVDSIVKRIQGDIIYVPPFQRNYVWNINQASKFIESLLLGLPVPGIFLSKENKTGRLIIVDGQQRLMSLTHFYQGIFKGKEFKLTGLTSDLNGLTYANLQSSDKIRLDDAIIHATIVRQDKPDDAQSSVYLIFERLNTGGKPLTAQEIRACIYYGKFNEFLIDAKKLPQWISIYGNPNDRMKEEELILRFFALFLERSFYEKPLKGFLNRFMSTNRDFEKYPKKHLLKTLTDTLEIFSATLGIKSFRIGRALNAALFEACMIAIAERQKRINRDIDPDKFLDAYEDLLSNKEFIALTQGPTSDEKNLAARIELAIQQFKKV